MEEALKQSIEDPIGGRNQGAPMRPPSRFGLTILTAFTALALCGSASANNVEPVQSIDSSANDSLTTIELVGAFENANARIDQRLSILLAGPTRMDCSNDLDTGFETCVVRAEGTPSAAPATLATN
jgi:hypothetical protein